MREKDWVERFMGILKRFDRYLTSVEKGFVAAGIMVTTLLVFSAVITRYFFNFSPPWIEELTEYITLWIVFVGAALCIKKHGHVNVDIIFHILPQRHGQILMGILSLLSGVFLAYFGYASYALITSAKATQQVSISMDWLPMFVVYLSALVGSLLMILEFFKLGWRFINGQEKLSK